MPHPTMQVISEAENYSSIKFDDKTVCTVGSRVWNYLPTDLTAGLVIQLFQKVTEDIFIWSERTVWISINLRFKNYITYLLNYLVIIMCLGMHKHTLTNLDRIQWHRESLPYCSHLTATLYELISYLEPTATNILSFIVGSLQCYIIWIASFLPEK